MRKRILSMLLSLALTLGLCVGMAGTAGAASVPLETHTIAGGDYQYVMVKTDGSVWMMDYAARYADVPQKPVKIMEGAVSVEGAGSSYYAIKKDGSLWGWGCNNSYQLGDGTQTDRTTPVKIMENVSYVCADNYRAAAIKADGSLWVWGKNGFTNHNDKYPMFSQANGEVYMKSPIKIMDNAKSVHLSYNRIDVVKSDGTLWSWGYNIYKGDGEDSDFYTPEPTKLMSGVKKTVGQGSIIALKDDGSVWGWGANWYGQLGCGTYENDRLTPVKMLLDGVTDIQGPKLLTMVLTDRGEAYVCGTFESNMGADSRQATPWKLADNAVAVCDTGQIVLKKDGTVWEWDVFQYKMVQTFSGVALPSKTTVNEPTTPPTAAGFTDVPAGAYYAAPVKWAVENGITAGTTATTFSPNQTCTRGQIITFLWRAAGSPEPHTTRNPFVDVSPEQYYYKACLWAREQGMLNVNAWPDTPCTRAAAVEFIWMQADQPEPTVDNPFTDVNDSICAVEPVLWALEEGITGGTSTTTFSPAQTCTRAQIMTFLYRGFGE